MKKYLRKKLKKNPFIYRYVSIIKEFQHRNFVDEIKYSKKKYKIKIGKEPDLNNPKTYTDKIMWLKFNWKDDLAKKCSDKWAVRDYVRKKGYGDILNQVYGVYEDVSEIDLDSLPDSFVMKATHGSGWNSFCQDKKSYNWKREKYKLATWLKLDYSWKNFEWLYRGIKPRIICEKYLRQGDLRYPTDYKIYCFGGEPRFTYACLDRYESLKFDYYDMNWVKHHIEASCASSDTLLPKPVNFDYMMEIARSLSKPFPTARIDLYEIDGNVVFGEITFLPSSGMVIVRPEDQDYIIGDMLDLPQIIGGGNVQFTDC